MIKWLQKDKKAAVCFSIDDIHPSKKTDYYEAGGDLSNGNLGLVEWLISRHPKLKTTLFVTADWREISPVPTRKILSYIPILKDNVFLAKRWPEGTMKLNNHPEFVNYLNKMSGIEIALHGLYHCHKGIKIPVEFQNQNEEEFNVIITKMLDIFESSGLKYCKGICPPGWNAPDSLLNQLVNHKVKFVASSRDIFSNVSKDALTNMSGIKGVPLIFPALLKNNSLVHIPTNFQATSKIERAFQIIDNGGLLSIKAHIVKTAFGFSMQDGVDELYMNYLDLLLDKLENKYGDDLWWTSMGEITENIFNTKDSL